MSMGHNPRTLTAANSVVLFKAQGYFDTPIRLEGFQVDNAFDFGDAAIGETVIGVDGLQSGGWTSHEVAVNLFLEANSASREQLENFRGWINSNKETALCTIDITIPATGRRVVASGFLVSTTGGTAAQKLLQGTQYTFNLVINGEESI